MGYRQFKGTTGLDEAIESTFFTQVALEAQDDAELAKLGKGVGALVAEGDAIAKELRAARRDVVRANARVRVMDGREEDEVRELDKDVLAAVRQDRDAPLYRALFPQTMSSVIALALEPQNAELTRIGEALGGKATPAALKKTWKTRLARLVEVGAEALTGRKRAAGAKAEVDLDVARWMERADRARRAVDGALTTYAANKGLPRDFNDRFFPAAPSRKGKGEPEGGDTPAA